MFIRFVDTFCRYMGAMGAEQISEQQYAYAKSGHLQFSHPENSHDDMLWALALAVTMSMQAPVPGVGAVMFTY